MATPFNTSTLGGFPILNPPPGYGRPANIMRWRSGASRFGVGTFLMAQSDYFTLTGGSSFIGTTTLVLNGGPDTTRNVMTLTVYVAGMAVTGNGVGSDDNVCEVVVFDQRSDDVTPIQKAYNVVSEPFSWNSGDYNYYSSTKNSGSPWTWAQVITNLNLFSGALPSAPSWTPRNLVFDHVASCRVIDEIAARLFIVVGWDGSKYSWCTPGSMNSYNTSLLQYAQNQGGAQIGGDDGDRVDQKVPGTIKCVFRNSNTADPYTNRYYTKTVTVGGSTNTGPTQALHLGDIPAVRASGAWANQSDMDTIASDMAQRFFAWVSVKPAEHSFAGIWPFQLDGAIRQIEWITDREGARTRIVLNNERHFDPNEDVVHSSVLPGNQLVGAIGAGNTSAHSGSGGKFAWSGVPAGVLFRVALTQTGGSNGNATTACSYTYTAKDLNNNQLGTSLSPEKPREVGTMYAATIGTGYYNASGTFVLYEAAEYATTTKCS